MNPQERLRSAIAAFQDALRSEIPHDRVAAVQGLLRHRDRLPRDTWLDGPPDLAFGRRLAGAGGNRALQLCLEAASDARAVPISDSVAHLDAWCARFLSACDRLVAAERVLAHSETGFMLLADDSAGRFDAWIATRRTPTSWRERADVSWWAAWQARPHAAELAVSPRASDLPRSQDGDPSAPHRRRAAAHLQAMAYQPGYPPDAKVGDYDFQLAMRILGETIWRALMAHDRAGQSPVWSERALVAEIAAALGADPDAVRQTVAAFAVDRESAAYHGAVPGVAAAPLVRLDPDMLLPSLYGLTTQPLLFLTRELRRRAAQTYHNTAILRESVFRQDLYGLFADRRFVTSAGRIELRRAAGDVRTDVDAAIFDRKSGTLAFFELKSQDPFARSTAEAARQRDNVLYANRQISGVLAWVQQHGANELLARVDSRTARTFRAQKVLPFALGRYVAHFGDGPEPDRRAAWGTWPQLLRLLDSQPIRANDANPLASLHNRLRKDPAPIVPPADGPSQEIALGPAQLVVHPSYAAFRSRTATTSAPE